MRYCRKAIHWNSSQDWNTDTKMHVFFRKNKNRRKRVSDDVIDCEDIKGDMLDKTLWSCQNYRHRKNNEVCWSSPRNYALKLPDYIYTWREWGGRDWYLRKRKRWLDPDNSSSISSRFKHIYIAEKCDTVHNGFIKGNYYQANFFDNMADFKQRKLLNHLSAHLHTYDMLPYALTAGKTGISKRTVN